MQEGWESFSPERPVFTAEQTASLFQKISSGTSLPQNEQSSTLVRPLAKSKVIGRLRWAVAAAIVLMIAGGAYLYRPDRGSKMQVAVSQHEAAPGDNKATLTLASGKKIVLDDAPNGELALDGSSRIIKKEDGRLEYNEQPVANGNGQPVLNNTMSTPRGGQYQLRLPDGTKVWLNAASSITYPTAFRKYRPSDGPIAEIKNERLVTVTGEAYFEVAPDPSSPFRVKVNDMTIEVLGTNFDVNAYPNRPFISASLLEGSVQVFKRNIVVKLQPGQQARVVQTGAGTSTVHDALSKKTIEVLDNIVADDVLAWKNGLFSFNNSDINEVLGEVSRWYDLDVIYEGAVPAQHYTGRPSRKLYASQMLQILEESGVHFRIEGKKLIINQ